MLDACVTAAKKNNTLLVPSRSPFGFCLGQSMNSDNVSMLLLKNKGRAAREKMPAPNETIDFTTRENLVLNTAADIRATEARGR